MLGIGERAPDLELPSTHEAELQLSKVFARHRATVLAFYALDFTPG